MYLLPQKNGVSATLLVTNNENLKLGNLQKSEK